MTNLQTLNERYELLSKFTKMYRKEITDFQGKLADISGECSKEDYMNFMDGLSDDAFTGNMMQSIVTGHYYDDIQRLVDGEIAFQDYVDMLTKGLWWTEI